MIGFQDEDIKRRNFLELSDEGFLWREKSLSFQPLQGIMGEKETVEFVTVLGSLLKPEEKTSI